MLSTFDVNSTLAVPVVILVVCKWINPPPLGSANVLSPLKKVVASLVPVAVSLARDTVLSDGTPRSRTDPSIWIKSITSPVTRLDAKVIVEPDTV